MAEGSLMDVTAEVELETTTHPLMTSCPQKPQLPATTCSSERHLCSESGYSYGQEKNTVRHRKGPHNMGDGYCFLFA